MNPRNTKPAAADDPTAEEVRVVTASEADSGTVEFDARGQPRWKYNENHPNRDPETTFDLLKALENAAIVFEEPAAPSVPQPKAVTGFNPYDKGPTKPISKK